jgi:hypothetical protein
MGKAEVLEEKPVPVLLCHPQFPHGLAQARFRGAAVRCPRITASAMERPYDLVVEEG